MSNQALGLLWWYSGILSGSNGNGSNSGIADYLSMEELTSIVTRDEVNVNSNGATNNNSNIGNYPSSSSGTKFIPLLLHQTASILHFS